MEKYHRDGISMGYHCAFYEDIEGDMSWDLQPTILWINDKWDIEYGKPTMIWGFNRI